MLGEHTTLKVQFWDAYGSERFGSLRAAFYRGAHAILVCYDTTNVNTFRSVENRWFKELEGMELDDRCLVQLVGTKCDLDQSRQVDTEEARLVAEAHGCSLTEVSCATPTNVDLVFHSVLDRIREIRANRRQQNNDPTTLDSEEPTIATLNNNVSCW